MAIRTIDRLLLIPALIVLGSVGLAGCSLLPGGVPTPSASSSASDEKSDDEQTDDSDDSDADATGGCPSSLTESTAGMAGLEGEVEFITAAEFSVPVIGADVLEGGCLFRVSVDNEGVPTTTDIGYIAGDSETVVAISADLEAGGYTKVADGIFTLSDNSGVFVFASEDMMSEAEVKDLGLGDSVVIVMATTTGE